jgi:hypothetical protein
VKDNVTPYDLLEEQVAGLRRELALRDEQLILQAKEYERRLEGLNGEAGRLRNMQQEYISREVFDREITSVRLRLSQSEAALIKAEGRHQLTQYVPWIIAAAAIVFDYFKK